jgi:hypothetical protein
LPHDAECLFNRSNSDFLGEILSHAQRIVDTAIMFCRIGSQLGPGFGCQRCDDLADAAAFRLWRIWSAISWASASARFKLSFISVSL